jgi:hypothetical protein
MGRLNHLVMDGATCRHISAFGKVRLPALHDAVLDAQPLAISKSDFPEPLRLPPDSAQPLGSFPQFSLVVRDAHVADIVVPPPGSAPVTAPM